MREVARGAVAGAVATVPMSLVMAAAHGLRGLGKSPPRKITERVLARAGKWPRRRRRRAASLASHVAFGAAAGAAASPALARVSSRSARVVAGTLAGLALWAGMYRYALPKLGLMASPRRDRPGRPLVMVLAHLVYGAALGAMAGRKGEERCPSA